MTPSYDFLRDYSIQGAENSIQDSLPGVPSKSVLSKYSPLNNMLHDLKNHILEFICTFSMISKNKNLSFY